MNQKFSRQIKVTVSRLKMMVKMTSPKTQKQARYKQNV
jgi:hypothetical protein